MFNLDKKFVVLHQGIDGSEDPKIDNAVRVRDNVSRSLHELGYRPMPVYLDNEFQWFSALRQLRDSGELLFVFNATDLGINYDMKFDPLVPFLLDSASIPYTGSDSKALVVGNDKKLAKYVMASHGILVPRSYNLASDIGAVEFPVILKPINTHNSDGIDHTSVIADADQLKRKLPGISNPSEYMLEEYIEGHDIPEICAGYVGNGGDRIVLPLVGFRFGNLNNGRPMVRTYDSKWNSNSDDYKDQSSERAEFPSYFEEDVSRQVSEIASALDIRDYARLDFRIKKLGNGMLQAYVIDVNANPDVNDDATLYKMANAAGFNYTAFVGKIAESAMKRYGLCQRDLMLV